jgi:hypothetical protein
MTDTRTAMKARAAALFRQPADEAKPDAPAEYEAKQEAERAKMARLRTMRMEAKGKRP